MRVQIKWRYIFRQVKWSMCNLIICAFIVTGVYFSHLSNTPFFPQHLTVCAYVWWVEKDALKFYRIAENSLSPHYADVIPKRVHKSISACKAKSCAANGQLIQSNDHLCLSKLSVLMNFHWNQAFMQPHASV